MRLTDKTIKALGEGRHEDGEGLRLVVSATGARSWILRFQMHGRRRDMGLGRYPDVSLKQARDSATDARRLIARGTDPIEAKNSAIKAKRRIPTFAEIAELVIDDAVLASANAKVQYQARRHLGPVYCGPILSRPVNAITTTEIAAMLRPVWATKPEVARKLYPMVRRVFDRARVILKADHGVIMPETPPAGSTSRRRGSKRQGSSRAGTTLHFHT